MSLYVCNFYPATVSVAIMWYDPFCEDKVGNYWTRQGWFNLSPVSCKKVLPNKTFPNTGSDLSDLNRYYCFYAQATDGIKWSGPYNRTVTSSPFHRADCLGYSSGFTVGFRLFDIDSNDDFTLTLIP